MAESAKIGHSLAGSTKSVDGFDRPVECSKHEPSSKKAHLKENLNGQFRLGSNAKTAITALSANLCRESQSLLKKERKKKYQKTGCDRKHKLAGAAMNCFFWEFP